MLTGSKLLEVMRNEDWARLEPHVIEMRLKAGAILYGAGEPTEFCFFPRGDAIAAYRVFVEGREAANIALVGREGVVGGRFGASGSRAFAGACVMQTGSFYRVASSAIEALCRNSEAITGLFERYSDYLLAQGFQTAACNARHSVEQRTAKWLCSCVEITGRPVVTMTQEQLASLMGVGRSYASRVVQRYRQAGLLETYRGRIEVLDLNGLKTRACSCDDHVRGQFDRVWEGAVPA